MFDGRIKETGAYVFKKGLKTRSSPRGLNLSGINGMCENTAVFVYGCPDSPFHPLGVNTPIEAQLRTLIYVLT